jgi:hypothetical protein
MKTISIKLLSELRVPLLPTNKQELVVKMERSRRAYLENLKQLERASEKLANGFIQKLFPQEIGA